MKLPTSHARTIHGYTRSHVPWKIDICEDDDAVKTNKFGKKLIRYIAGGGIKSLARTVRQEEIILKRNRFLIFAAIIGFIWLLILIF